MTGAYSHQRGSAPAREAVPTKAVCEAGSVTQLVQPHQGLVRSIAWQILQRLPPHVEIDDLIADGQVGLLQAARDFDPNRGNRFTSYAFYRVRGAILDGLSKRAWFSRREFHARRYEQAAHELVELDALDDERGAMNEPQEAAQWLGRMCRTLAVAYLATSTDPEDSHRATVEDIAAEQPDDHVMDQELRHRLSLLVHELEDPARSLITMTYYQGMTLQDAARRLQLSKSWASRLHARTLDRLAHALRLLGADGASG